MTSSKKARLPNRSYNWEGMLLGETRVYTHAFPGAARTSFVNFARVRKWDGWYCEIRTDPPTLKKGERAATVWVTRVEKPTPTNGTVVGIEAAKVATLLNGPLCLKATGIEYKPVRNRFGNPFRPVVIDLRQIPLELRARVYEERAERVRISRAGWDRMQLGDFQFSCARFGAILSQIKTTCLPRNLLYAFELRRVEAPDGHDASRVWWLVSRVR
jgi:hypothetical protein